MSEGPEHSGLDKTPKPSFASLFEQAIEDGARLTFTRKESPFDFSPEEIKEYAAIGKYVTEIARLEYDIDDFVFLFAEKFPNLTKSINSNPPFKIEEKAEFIVYAHVLYSKLRECGDLDGNMNLQYLYYGIIELFDKRNIVVHGSITFSEHFDGGFIVGVRKFRRIDKRNFGVEQVRYGPGFLENSLSDAHYIRTFIWRAKKVLEGRADLTKERDQLLRGRASLRFIKQRFPDLIPDD